MIKKSQCGSEDKTITVRMGYKDKNIYDALQISEKRKVKAALIELIFKWDSRFVNGEPEPDYRKCPVYKGGVVSFKVEHVIKSKYEGLPLGYRRMVGLEVGNYLYKTNT